MRFSLLELEPRDTPSVDYGTGVVPIPGHGSVQPFPDFFGGVTTLTVGNLMTIGAQAPGGPRVAQFSLTTGERTQADFFAGDPASRAGVVLVDTGGTIDKPPTVADAPAPAFAVPDWTWGDPADPKNWVIDLDFQNPKSAEWAKAVGDEIWRVVQPLGNVALVTRRPAEDPNWYGVVNIGVDLSYVPSEGLTGGLWGTRRNGELVQVAVDGRDLLPTEAGGHTNGPNGVPVDPLEVGEIAAHEIGHALGLVHDPDPASIMNTNSLVGQTLLPGELATARANAAAAAEITQQLRDESAAATRGATA